MRAFSPAQPPARRTLTSWTLTDLPAEIATEYFAAIVTNSGTISAGNQTKVSTLLATLQTAGLYRKVRALYLYHGNTLNAARLNALNPTTNPGAHVITWTGSPTLDANGGFTPAVGAYGLTALHPDGAGLTDLFGAGMGFYSTSNAATSEYTMGVYDELYLAPKETGTSKSRCSGTFNSGTVQDLSGFHFVSREPSSGSVKMFRNGAVHTTTTKAFASGYGIALATGRVKVGGMIEAGVTHYASTTPVKLSVITDGLSESEVATLNTAIQAYVA